MFIESDVAHRHAERALRPTGVHPAIFEPFYDSDVTGFDQPVKHWGSDVLNAVSSYEFLHGSTVS